jgi:ribosomal protein S13
MARIAGINIPPQKHAEIGLTAIYGVGRTTAQQICDRCGIDRSKKVKDLTDGDLEKIRERSAHAHQRAHSQGPAQVGRRAEEVIGLRSPQRRTA